MQNSDTQSLFQQGIDAGAKRNYAKAKNIFLLLTQMDHPQAALYLARSYHGLGEYEKAVILFQSLLSQKEDPLTLFLLGRSLLQVGQLQRATPILERALRMGYQEDPIWGVLGMAYIRLRRPEAACEVLKKGVQAYPSSKPLYEGYLNALYITGLKKYRQGNMELAAGMLQFVKDNGLNNTSIALHLGNCYKELGQNEFAMDNYQEAFLSHPDDPAIQRMILNLKDRIDYSKDNVSSSPKTFQKNDIEEEKWLASEFFRQKDFAKALNHSLRLIQKGQTGWEIHFLTAEAYRKLGRWTKALDHYQRSRTFRPDFREASMGLLWVLWEIQNYSEVIREAQVLLNKEPENLNCQYYLTLAQYRSMKEPGSFIIQSLSELLLQRPKDADLLIANAKLKGSWELIHKALKLHPYHQHVFVTAFSLDPELKKTGWQTRSEKFLIKNKQDPLALRILIRIFMKVQNFEKAKRHLIKLASLGSLKTFHQRALAQCYRKLGQFEEALVLYKILLEQDEHNLELITHALYCLEKSGQNSRASHFLASVLSHHPNASDLILRLAVQEYKNGNFRESLKYFHKVLEKYPRDTKLIRTIAVIHEKMGNILEANNFHDHARKFQ